jgi:hypothetical protein
MDYYEEDNEYNEYNQYEEDYENEDNIQMEGEVNAFERVGLRNDFNMIDLENLDKKNKLKKTPLERFYETTNAICQQLFDKNKLSEIDIKNILENIGKIDKPEYKNATGYILGYIVSNGGNKIIKKKLLDSEDILDNLEDKSVQIPDIIRYSRLWMNLNK